MDRRTFVALVGGGILASPLAGETQQSAKVPQIGVLGNMLPAASAEWGAFRQGLRELGWIEGQNVAIAYRGAEGNPDRFPALAVELVQLKVDVIVVTGPPAIHAVRNATSTIPIVFVALADPVASGYVTSLARPGGNLTGLASQYEELITKQLQLLKEAVPTISRIALLHHRESWPAILNAAAQAGACCAGFTLLRLPGAVAPLFAQWLSQHFPAAKDKVLNRLRDMRQGQLNDPRFGSRMHGEGILADHIANFFRLARRNAGLDHDVPDLSTAHFRRPGTQPLLFE